MRRLPTAVISLAIAIVASLMLARIHPFGDAGLYAASPDGIPILNNPQVPRDAHNILAEKCADCHSSQPRAPFYGRFAPVSWLMERDMVQARKAMNLSLWNTYPPDQQQARIAKIVQEAKSRAMPPAQYRAIHWNAWITDSDVEVLSQWAYASRSTPAEETAVVGGDPARGKALFEKRCTGCHALSQNHEGPQLLGVYGRTSGTVPKFAYSPALKKAHIVWDQNSLDKWLTDPDAFLPGNDMDFLVSKPQERQDLISFLKLSSGK